jgi:signal transduction histidine kinase
MALPAWARTVRARLTLTYSALLFAIAAVLLAGVYVALAASLDAKPLESSGGKFYVTSEGHVKFLGASGDEGEYVSAADLDIVQDAVNAATLTTLRTYTGVALVALFLVSLLVGWWVSGRVLRPVEAITRTTREITASDLSRRIGATGPRDELRTLADTIDEMLARIEREFTAQRALVDDVSHELRNPVAVILANSDAVFADPDASVENRRRAAAVVSGAAASMARLIDDLLALARQRSGAYTEAELDLRELAAGAASEYEALAAPRELRIVVRGDSRGPRVYADGASLTRALRNLLANAVRFSPDGGEVLVAVGSQRGWAWVAVRDQGPGVPVADRDRVFDRYYTAPNGSSSSAGSREPGTGIGLAIARQVVESHDGRLSLFSEPGRGSTFVVWLPDRTDLGPGDRTSGVPQEDPLGGWPHE